MKPRVLPAVLPGIVHVVDDDDAFRTALARVLTVAGHRPKLYASAAEYLGSTDPDGPACVVLDLRMPGITGLDLQSALLQRGDAHPVIFLSGHGDIPSTVRAMREGALDFLIKPVPTTTLLAAIHRGLENDLERTRGHAQRADLMSRYGSLTPRERQVMAGVVAGRLNKQICYALHAAERTVKTHRARVMEKMRVRSVAELVRLAEQLVKAGLVLEPVAY
jgi:FixJ family two-component response regulator